MQVKNRKKHRNPIRFLLDITVIFASLALVFMFFSIGILEALIGGLSGAAALIGFYYCQDYIWTPSIKTGDFYIEHEQGSMPCKTKHLRLDVEAEYGSLTNVDAEIVDGSNQFVPSGKRSLFWERQFQDHGHEIHSTLETTADVMQHIDQDHIEEAGPVDINKGRKKSVNILFKIEGIPETFIANRRGEASTYNNLKDCIRDFEENGEYKKSGISGQYELDIIVSSNESSPVEKTVRFKVGPRFEDLEIL